MAKENQLPDFKEKRKTVYSSNTAKETLVDYGNRLLAAQRINDALDFYEKAEYEDGIKKILTMSLNDGDAFIFARVVKILKNRVSAEGWNRVGDNAAERGKYHFALRAYKNSGNQEGVHKIEQILAGKGQDAK